MAIEKRVIAGHEVGFNTETNSYCNLPNDCTGNGSRPDFAGMTDEQLAVYAEKAGIDVSRLRSRESIIARLEKESV